LLRRGLDGEGFGVRRTMDLQDMDPKLCVYWGSFSGRQCGDSWIQLALGGYIPMDIKGVRHAVAATRGPHDGKRGAVRLQGASQAKGGGRAQSSGGKGFSGLAAEPRPPASNPAAEEGTAELGRNLEQFFCKWDDEHLRASMPSLLPHGWQQLTNRQIKRFVCRWRKSQCVWRFREQGGFREYVLARMQGEDFEKLQDEQKEEHWQTYRGCPEPGETDGLGAARAAIRDVESRDRSSRSRGRPRRRIAGVDSSDSV